MILNSTISDKTSLRFFDFAEDPNLVPVPKLAFLGDAVIELMVREYLVENGETHFRAMNARKAEFVNARAQSATVDRVLGLLSDEELAVYRRGKNSKHKNYPKTASALDYCKATGLETVMGYLYLKNDRERLYELFFHIIGE